MPRTWWSRGGLSTTMYAATAALGNPVRLIGSPGRSCLKLHARADHHAIPRLRSRIAVGRLHFGLEMVEDGVHLQRGGVELLHGAHAPALYLRAGDRAGRDAAAGECRRIGVEAGKPQ